LANSGRPVKQTSRVWVAREHRGFGRQRGDPMVKDDPKRNADSVGLQHSERLAGTIVTEQHHCLEQLAIAASSGQTTRHRPNRRTPANQRRALPVGDRVPQIQDSRSPKAAI
jgi:hypothetical protein